MVFLYNAAGKGEAEAPAAFLGGEAGSEHLFHLVAGYAFAVVLYIYPYLLGGIGNSNVYLALASHCIECIADKVFHYPVEKRPADIDGYICLGFVQGDIYFLW